MPSTFLPKENAPFYNTVPTSKVKITEKIQIKYDNFYSIVKTFFVEAVAFIELNS